MKFLSKNHLFLIGILLFAVVVRFYQLGSIPSILNPDEASIAYNAFLLRETGQDEWGQSWPLILQAFGDQKPIIYPLATVLSFSLFGYSDFAVRLPSAIAGVIIVFLGYKISQLFLLTKKQSLLTAGILSILPVFIFYSRSAYEAVLALALTLAVLFLTYKERQKQWKYDLLAILFSVIAYFTYNAPFIVLPLIILPIPLLRGVTKVKKWLPVVAMMFVAWLGAYFLLSNFNQQKSQITIFSEEYFQEYYIPYRQQFSGISQQLLGNKYAFYGREVTLNTIEAFDPRFLLFNADGHPWHALPGTGYLYVSVYIFGMVGLMVLLGRIGYNLIHLIVQLSTEAKVNPYQLKWQDLLLLWLLLASLLPASITVNAPHATRTLFFYILFVILAVKGWKLVAYFIQKVFPRQLQLTKVLAIFWMLIVCFEASIYLHQYFVSSATDQTQQSVFYPGYKQVLEQIEAQYPESRVAVIDGRGFQYVLTAWYLKIQPGVFFNTVKKQQPDSINFRYGEQVERYRFIKNPEDRRDEDVLLYWDQNQWVIEKY